MKRLAIALVLFSVGSLPAAEPEWKSELTTTTPGSHPQLAPSSLDLQLSWKGIVNSGKIRIDFAPKDAKKPGAYVIRSSASSLGAASALFPYRSDFWSEIDPQSLKPRLFHAVETDSDETTTTKNRHFSDRVECDEVSKALKGGLETSKSRVFRFAPVYEMFSAMLFIRSQKLDEGDKIALVINPFGTPYLLRVKVEAKESHMEQSAIRLTVGMRKIDTKTLELKPYKKLKNDATLWLSDDDKRVPIEFRAAVFIGDVRATLSSYQKS